MKTLFSSKTLIALAVAVAAAAAYETEANEQPIPPPATDGALPEGVQPGSPIAQVVELVQAGVDTSVIQTFIANCPSGFNLDAEKIIVLTDAGLSGDLMNAMFAHDKALLASISTEASAPPDTSPIPQPETTAPSVATDYSTGEPPQEVTINYFYDNLAPYGSWVAVDGYGYCWRPTAGIYDPSWRPYCDRGRWVYTDCGWYWNSDYAWGATFHYGRWFNSPRYGWCWWPDTVWAPSWVTWRSGNDYCGWAPLPPFTVYHPGIGFTYHGNNVAVGFDFGLGVNCFTFVSSGNFCQPQPRRFCVPQTQVAQFYSQTTIINNFDYNNHHRLQNNGISTAVISAATRHPVQTVPVSGISNARRHGWNGGNFYARNFGADHRENQAVQNTSDNNSRPGSSATAQRHPMFGAPNQTVNRAGGPQGADRITASPMPARLQQQNQNPSPVRDLVLTGHPVQNSAPVVGNNFAAGTAPVRGQVRQPLTAGGVESRRTRQPAWPFNAPPSVDRPQTAQTVSAPPVQVASAPVVSTERPQMSRGESRQSLGNNNSQTSSASRNAKPSAPASAPGQTQPSGNGGNFRGQGWVVQNH